MTGFTIHHPLEKRVVSGCRRPRMREPQQIAMRPYGLILRLQQLTSKLAGGLVHVPIGYGRPKAAPPTSQVRAERGEFAKLRTGARDTRQSIQRRGISLGI